MSTQTAADEIITLASGQAFNDMAAAQMKADLLTAQRENQYDVIPHGEGWAVKLKAKGVPISAVAAKEEPISPRTVNSCSPPLEKKHGSSVSTTKIKKGTAKEIGARKADKLPYKLRSSYQNYPKNWIIITAAVAVILNTGTISTRIASYTAGYLLPQVTPDRIALALAAICLMIAVVSLLSMMVKRFSCRYIITEFTVESYVGIFSRTRCAIKIRDIRSMVIRNQSLYQRAVNIGNIELGTAGPIDVEVLFAGIEKPNDILKKIENLMERSQMRGD